MQIHHNLYEEQPDARSNDACNIASAIIALEQMRHIGLGYSNAIILHGNCHLILFHLRAHGDRSSARRIFYRISDKIAERLK